MTHNDILRRLRYAFDYNDQSMMRLFVLGGREVGRSELLQWMSREGDSHKQAGAGDEEAVEAFPLSDVDLACFLNGLIIERRGARGDGPPAPEQRLSNNVILRKLRIALNFKDEDMLATLKLGGLNMSKPELSAFFRKPEHKNYRACQDQVLRRFIRGLQEQYRGRSKGQRAASPQTSDAPAKNRAVNAKIWGK